MNSNYSSIQVSTPMLAAGLREDPSRYMDFVIKLIAEFTAYFFVIIFNLIFTRLIEIIF